MTQRRNQGFTMIELMLSMTFVSILLLAIVMTSIQAGRMYNRGMIMRSVNQSGRDLTAQLRRDFMQASAQKISPIQRVTEAGMTSSRLCFGGYSYLWNDPNVIDAIAVPPNNPAVIYDQAGQPINLVRVVDEDGAYCEERGGKFLNRLPAEQAKVAQLLKTQADRSEVVLALHSMKLDRLIDGDDQSLYRVSFTLGTSKVSEIRTSDQTCKPPSDNEANLEFCAINQFEMIVRTNG